MLALCLDTLVPMIKREGMPGWIQEFEMGGGGGGGGGGGFRGCLTEFRSKGGGGGGAFPGSSPGMVAMCVNIIIIVRHQDQGNYWL